MDCGISESSVGGISEDDEFEVCNAKNTILEGGDKLVKRNDMEMKITGEYLLCSSVVFPGEVG